MYRYRSAAISSLECSDRRKNSCNALSAGLLQSGTILVSRERAETPSLHILVSRERANHLRIDASPRRCAAAAAAEDLLARAAVQRCWAISRSATNRLACSTTSEGRVVGVLQPLTRSDEAEVRRLPGLAPSWCNLGRPPRSSRQGLEVAQSGHSTHQTRRRTTLR